MYTHRIDVGQSGIPVKREQENLESHGIGRMHIDRSRLQAAAMLLVLVKLYTISFRHACMGGSDVWPYQLSTTHLSLYTTIRSS